MEVLCDFIIDKAKRLFSKYDSVSKEKKLLQDEFKNRRNEKENRVQNSHKQFADRVTNYIIPRVADLDETKSTKEDVLEYAYNVLENVESEFR